MPTKLCEQEFTAVTVNSSVMLNKVVVAYLDGRRLRGCLYDFSPIKDEFSLVQDRDLPQRRARKYR